MELAVAQFEGLEVRSAEMPEAGGLFFEERDELW
jgi:hypothetical protein